MSTTTPRGAFTLALVATLAACTEPPTGVEPSVRVEETDPATAKRAHQHRPTVRRFDVEVTVAGRLAPGQPITITATTSARLAAGRARLEIVAPELESARLSGWGDDFEMPVGRPLPPLVSERVGAGAGGQHRQVAHVTFPAPGYYRVVASAITEDGELVTAEGNPVQGVTHKEVWLLIAEDGSGRTTPAFEPAAVPETVIPVPGPFRGRRTRAPDAKVRPPSSEPPPGLTLSTAGGAGDAAAPSTNYYNYNPSYGNGVSITFQVLYYDADARVMRGLPDANVQFDVRYQQYWTLQSGGMYTNADGFFFIQCPGVQYTSIRGSVKTWQPYNFSTGMTTTFGEWWLPGCTDMTSPRAFQIVTGSEHARVYHNLVLTLNRSHPLFGVKRGYINVKVYPGVSGTSNYTETWWDDIEIYGDDVWGSRGVFTVAHEYGHATQAKSLGGMNGGECGGSHWLTDAINMQCAYSEGFADFFAAITREDEAAYTASYIRPGPFPVYNRSTGQAVYDGSVSEGPVAAFLYDLIDSADDVNESFDRVSFSGTYLASVLRTCRIYNPLYRSFTGPTRIDQIIACMENTTDIYYPSFFPSAGALRVIIYNESADESSAGGWSPSAIRALWRHDLYRQ